ncbi:MAG: FRG domain-containing protein [Lachnospiraceae bacterium]|nr:FRG domain-containing protein [Lachnospiraceae bacterium]
MKNTFQTLTYSTWYEMKKDLTKDICNRDNFPYNKFLFRGHSSEEWGLTATLDRRYSGLALGKRKEKEKFLLENFRDMCITWEGRGNLSNCDEKQLMSIGQHYGLPTRLLDWTYSIYIAAFFAFSDLMSDASNVAIWVLDKEHEIWNANYGVTIVNARVEENDRQKYQYGVFTLNESPCKSIEEYVETCGKQYCVDGALYKIILPSNERKIVLNDLEMMGLTPYNLYRGIEGCARTTILREFMQQDTQE